jgi:hypothetical protein
LSILEETETSITFSYEKGTHCDVTNKERKSNVTLICDKEERFETINEPSTCIYALFIRSPLACNPGLKLGGVKSYFEEYKKLKS